MSDFLFEVLRRRLKCLCRLMEDLLQICVIVHQTLGCQSLNSPHACCHTGLRDDLKGADGRGIVHMGSATEFLGKFSHADYPYNIPVLLSKQCLCSGLLRLFNRKILHFHRKGVRNCSVDNLFHLFDFLRCQRGEMGEIKAQSCGVHIRTCLLYVGAKYGTQRFLKQVGRTMVSSGKAAVFLVYFQNHVFPGTDHAFYCCSDMSNLTAEKFFHIFYLEDKASILRRNHAMVRILSAACGIEWRLLDKDRSLYPFGQCIGNFALCCQHCHF